MNLCHCFAMLSSFHFDICLHFVTDLIPVFYIFFSLFFQISLSELFMLLSIFSRTYEGGSYVNFICVKLQVLT